MEEQLISFETSKLAREKGYNEPCKMFYYIEELYDGEVVGDIYESQLQINDDFEGSSAAPTQSLLQKWLRETCEIDVFAISVRFIGYLEIGYYTYTIKGVYPTKSYRFKTYEEALEIGLKEALELIK